MKTPNESDRPEVLALIPVRSAEALSHGQSARRARERMLLIRTIELARAVTRATRVIVAAERESAAYLARAYGVEAPMLLPSESAEGFRTDLDIFQHMLRWLQVNEGYVPDLCIHLPPAETARSPGDIDAMVEILHEDPGLDSVTTVLPAPQVYTGSWHRDERGRLHPWMDAHRETGAVPTPPRTTPAAYQPAGGVTVIRTGVIRARRSMRGSRVHGYVLRDAQPPPPAHATTDAARRFILTPAIARLT
jgi:N-acylneuraminate cytidylyltransferase